jgi:RNA polymerase sigma-70 factor, ECF subfamily
LAERTTTAAEDHELIRRIGGGDHAAFRVFVARYNGPLYSFILRMVRQPAVAEELVQETFVRAYRAAPRYKSISSVSTWLFAIAARLSMNEAARAHHSHEEEGEAPEVPGETPGPLEELERKALGRAIEAALARLPPQQRAAVVLARFEEMSYREISSVLGVSEGAVDGLLQRARQTLCVLLGPVL